MNKYKIVALIMLIALVIFPIVSSTAIASTVNYILNDGFESGTYNISQWSNKQTDSTKNYSYVFQSTYVYSGKYSAKVVSSCNDASLSGLRSELVDSSVVEGQEYWYGFAVMVPEYWETTPTWNIVAQWHATEDPGEKAISPPLALDIQQRIWTISVGNTTLKLITDNNDANRTYTHYSIAPVQPLVWTTWVFNVKWSPTNTGKLVVWKDGVVVLNRTNLPVGYNDAIGPYFKTGIYRANTTDPNYCIKTVYNDAYRITDSSGSYAAVDPAQTYVPPINKTIINNTTTNNTISVNNTPIVNKTLYIPPIINVILSSVDSTVNSDLDCTYTIVGNYSKSSIYWYKNNHYITKGPSIISKSNLSVGDTWYCRINVTGIANTTLKSSNTITIIPPIVEVVENTTISDGSSLSTGGSTSSGGAIHRKSSTPQPIENYTSQNTTTINETYTSQNTTTINETDTSQNTTLIVTKTSSQSAEPIKEEPSRALIPIIEHPTKTTNNTTIYIITLSLIIVIISTLTTLIWLKRNDNVETNGLIINYIEKALDIGYDKAAIGTALRVKLPSNVINHHLRQVKIKPKVRYPVPVSDAIEYDPTTIKKVKEYVMNQKQHHFLDKDISNMLIHYGYSRRLVEMIGLR